MPTAQFSSKGQIVIPKAIRDRHAFGDGQLVEVIETPAGVLLRLPIAKATETAEAVIARFRARNTYQGPPVSLDEMRTAADEVYSGRADPNW